MVMTVSARLKHLLDENHVNYSLMPHMKAYTAQAAAAVMHVPGSEIAKTVVLHAGHDLVLAVLPATHHVNLKRMGDILGTPVSLASEADFVSHFPDCEPGAMPPFGRLYGMRVYVDVTLAEDDEIVFEAGSHREAMRLHYADFERLAEPVTIDFADEG
jgi:Ala-tRNA(Pro) deacylase